MAERRMFAKTIVTSDAFLDMPMSARCLYFTLGMFADDDGFVNNPKSILRQIGASDDDMRVLLSKKFVLSFESGVIVIKHWRINNYLRNDRYHATTYQEEKKLLAVDENGAYTDVGIPGDGIVDNSEVRKLAYKESDLPYSFEYKIRQAFNGHKCPICGYEMENTERGKHRPTIQHNTPLSKGGKHELSNISVICHECNVSLRDTPTDALNNAEVIEKWNEICGTTNVVYQGRYTENSIDKNSIGESIAPTLDMIKEYCEKRKSDVDAERFYNYYSARGWKMNHDIKMTDWRAALRAWERKKDGDPDAKQKILDDLKARKQKLIDEGASKEDLQNIELEIISVEDSIGGSAC